MYISIILLMSLFANNKIQPNYIEKQKYIHTLYIRTDLRSLELLHMGIVHLLVLLNAGAQMVYLIIVKCSTET